MEVARAYVSNLPAGKLLYWIISQLNYAALVSHLSFCSKFICISGRDYLLLEICFIFSMMVAGSSLDSSVLFLFKLVE
jgi:hypothetical protein